MSKLNEPCTEKCRFFAIRLDESQCWKLDGLKPRPDRVVSTFLFSPDIGIHICEATTSSELHFIECRPEWDEDTDDDEVLQARERVATQVNSANFEQDSVTYMHRHDVLHWCPGLREIVDSTPEIPKDAHGENWTYVDSLNPDDLYDELTVQGLVDYCQGNQVV